MNIARHVRTMVFRPQMIPTLASLAIDDLRGLDFLRNVEPETVGLDPSQSFHYSPTKKKWLRSVLRGMHITGADTIVDVGCGKGAAMRIMLDFPFSRVEGVELSVEMAAIARNNFKRLHYSEDRVAVHNADACDFDELDHFSHIYLYNPFPCSVCERFLQRVLTSLEHRPRRLTIIYNNPVCHDVVIGSGRFRKTLELIADWDNPLYVYESA